MTHTLTGGGCGYASSLNKVVLPYTILHRHAQPYIAADGPTAFALQVLKVTEGMKFSKL